MTLIQKLGSRRSTILEWFVIIAVALYGVRLLTQMPPDFQWDLRTYYDSAKAFTAGLNPYDRHPLVIWEYTYLPLSLWIFVPFTWLDQSVALFVWLILKITLLIGLIVLWRLKFLAEEGDGLFYIFCLLAFNSTIFLDMRAGNVSVIEQAFIWLAFFFFLRRNYFWFCVLLMIGSIFKGLPLAFLMLLWLTDSPKRRLYFFGSLAVFGGMIGLTFLVSPNLLFGFLGNATGHVESAGPSNFYFIKASFRALYEMTRLSVPDSVQTFFFYGVAGVVVLLTAWACARLKFVADGEKVGVFLLCSAYGLLPPYFADYAYIPLIVPAFFIFKRTRLKAFLPLFLIASLSPLNLLPHPSALDYLWQYYPVLTAYSAFALYLYEIHLAASKAGVKITSVLPRQRIQNPLLVNE